MLRCTVGDLLDFLEISFLLLVYLRKVFDQVPIKLPLLKSPYGPSLLL